MLKLQEAILLRDQIKNHGRIDLLVVEVLGLSLEPFHIQLLKFAVYMFETKGEGLVLAPRGFGKSTITTVCFAIWLILKNPNLRILVGSSTAVKAEAFLQEIKSHFENNEKLKELFGDQYNRSAWKSTDIIVIDRDKILKEPTLSARGQSGAVVGSHYDVHLIDDIVNEDNARTKGQRDKLREWFYMSLDPTLEPDGFRMNIGTRYHPQDLYNHMIVQSELEIKQAEQDALERKLAGEEEEAETIHKKLRPLKVLKLAAIKKDGTSLWESKFSIKKLKQKQQRMGLIAFNAQFQNETDLMKGKILKEEYFEFYDPKDFSISGLKVFQGVDLNAGRGNTNDWFALVTKAYDPMTMKAYTMDVVRGRYTFREQMIIILWKAGRTKEEIQKLMSLPDLTYTFIMGLFKDQPVTSRRQYRSVVRIGVESVVYQTVLPDTLLELSSSLPIAKVTHRMDKETRIMSYAARWENHLEYLPDDNTVDRLKEEALLFPEVDNDDVIDAHEICNSVADNAFKYGQDEDEDSDVSVRVFK